MPPLLKARVKKNASASWIRSEVSKGGKRAEAFAASKPGHRFQPNSSSSSLSVYEAYPHLLLAGNPPEPGEDAFDFAGSSQYSDAVRLRRGCQFLLSLELNNVKGVLASEQDHHDTA